MLDLQENFVKQQHTQTQFETSPRSRPLSALTLPHAFASGSPTLQLIDTVRVLSSSLIHHRKCFCFADCAS
jgi:hypothetical protein